MQNRRWMDDVYHIFSFHPKLLIRGKLIGQTHIISPFLSYSSADACLIPPISIHDFKLATNINLLLEGPLLQ